jgi:hypothetical protein
MNVQRSESEAVVSRLRTYERGEEAIVLLTTSNPEMSIALGRVFALQEAQDVELEKELPWDEPDVGDCLISDSSAVLTIEGSGGAFMGMRFETRWGRTDPVWRACAGRTGRVWLALVGLPDYARIANGGAGELLPRARTLKLEVSP